MRRGPPFAGSRFTTSTAPVRGGSSSHLSKCSDSPRVWCVRTVEVGQTKLGILELILLRVALRLLDQHRIGLYAQYPAGTTRQRKGEVAQTAEEIKHGLVGLRIEQFQCARHHALIEFGVHLDEIGRRKFQLHVCLR